MVRSRRLELPRGLAHSDLNAARLPIPPRPHVSSASTSRGLLQACGGNTKSRCPDQANEAAFSKKTGSPMTAAPHPAQPPEETAPDTPRDRVADQRRTRSLPRGGRRDGGAGHGDPGGHGAGAGLAAGTPAPLHGGHQRPPGGPAGAGPLPDLPVGPGRPVHLSRAGPAGGLCDDRSEASPAGPGRPRYPRLRQPAGGMADPDAGPVQRQGRAARGPRRHLGRSRDRMGGSRATRTRSRRWACGCAAG